MPDQDHTRPGGAHATPRPRLRRLATLLVALQLAAPVAAVYAEPAPAAATHVDHIDAQDGPGCQAVHDEIYCLSCRVLFSSAVQGVATPGLSLPGHGLLPEPVATLDRLRDNPAAARLHARAPPRI